MFFYQNFLYQLIEKEKKMALEILKPVQRNFTDHGGEKSCKSLNPALDSGKQPIKTFPQRSLGVEAHRWLTWSKKSAGASPGAFSHNQRSVQSSS
jgi:hypothetical protein